MLTKPETERGNYLVYTDEPGAIMSPGSGGGGGGDIVIRSIVFDDGMATGMDFSYNDLLNTSFTFLRATDSSAIGWVGYYTPYHITATGETTTYEAYFSDGTGTYITFYADTADETMRYEA